MYKIWNMMNVRLHLIFLFTCAVLYDVSKRIGVPKLQRQVRAAFKAGMVGKELGPGAVGNGVNHAPPYQGPVNKVEEPLERLMHDELCSSMIVYVLSFSMFRFTPTNSYSLLCWCLGALLNMYTSCLILEMKDILLPKISFAKFE